MSALIATLWVTSVLGSVHCVGMCGPFAAFALGTDPIGGAKSTRSGGVRLQLAYHGGRLLTYAALGALAGWFGVAIDLGAEAIGVARGATVLAGFVLAVYGVGMLARARGVRLPGAPLPAFIKRWALGAHRRVLHLSPVKRALTIGLLTTLLPCGWLYAFVVSAAGTASPGLGALVMVVFWSGTVPLLAGLGMGVRALSGRLSLRLQTWTSLLLIVLGLYTVGARGALVGVRAMARSQSGAAVEAVGTERAPFDPVRERARLEAIDQDALPCCRHDDGE